MYGFRDISKQFRVMGGSNSPDKPTIPHDRKFSSDPVSSDGLYPRHEQLIDEKQDSDGESEGEGIAEENSVKYALSGVELLSLQLFNDSSEGEMHYPCPSCSPTFWFQWNSPPPSTVLSHFCISVGYDPTESPRGAALLLLDRLPDKTVRRRIVGDIFGRLPYEEASLFNSSHAVGHTTQDANLRQYISKHAGSRLFVPATGNDARASISSSSSRTKSLPRLLSCRWLDLGTAHLQSSCSFLSLSVDSQGRKRFTNPDYDPSHCESIVACLVFFRSNERQKTLTLKRIGFIGMEERTNPSREEEEEISIEGDGEEEEEEEGEELRERVDSQILGVSEEAVIVIERPSVSLRRTILQQQQLSDHYYTFDDLSDDSEKSTKRNDDLSSGGEIIGDSSDSDDKDIEMEEVVLLDERMSDSPVPSLIEEEEEGEEKEEEEAIRLFHACREVLDLPFLMLLSPEQRRKLKIRPILPPSNLHLWLNPLPQFRNIQPSMVVLCFISTRQLKDYGGRLVRENHKHHFRYTWECVAGFKPDQLSIEWLDDQGDIWFFSPHSFNDIVEWRECHDLDWPRDVGTKPDQESGLSGYLQMRMLTVNEFTSVFVAHHRRWRDALVKNNRVVARIVPKMTRYLSSSPLEHVSWLKRVAKKMTPKECLGLSTITIQDLEFSEKESRLDLKGIEDSSVATETLKRVFHGLSEETASFYSMKRWTASFVAFFFTFWHSIRRRWFIFAIASLFVQLTSLQAAYGLFGFLFFDQLITYFWVNRFFVRAFCGCCCCVKRSRCCRPPYQSTFEYALRVERESEMLFFKFVKIVTVAAVTLGAVAFYIYSIWNDNEDFSCVVTPLIEGAISNATNQTMVYGNRTEMSFGLINVPSIFYYDVISGDNLLGILESCVFDDYEWVDFYKGVCLGILEIGILLFDVLLFVVMSVLFL